MSKKMLCAFMIFMGLSGCATLYHQEPLEAIVASHIDVADWKVGYQKQFGVGKGYIREFIPLNDSIGQWSKMLTIEFLERNKSTPQEFTEQFMAQRKSQCPSTEFKILESDIDNIYYKVDFPECMGHLKQSELTRVIRGNDGLHRISYSTKGDLTDVDATKWFNEFKQAKLVKGREKTIVVR